MPSAASVPAIPDDPASAYIAARAASISGAHADAAQIYANLAAASADDDLKQRAIHEAISAGDMPLALRLIRATPDAPPGINSKLLLVGDALKRGKDSDALKLLDKDSGGGVDLGFWAPLLKSWTFAERRDSAQALAELARIPKNNALAPFVDEESAFILMRLGKTVEAEPFARRAIGDAGAREFRLRLALAGAFDAAGDRQRASAMIEGIPGDTTAIRRALQSGRLKRFGVDSASKAFADQLIALAIELRRSERAPADPVNIVQVARFVSPDNSSTAILLGNLLADDDRLDEALAAYRSVAADDPLKGEALDSEARALTGAKRFDEALRLTQAAAGSRDSTADDFARLGDVYSAMNRFNEAAEAFGQAIERTKQISNGRLWPLLLLRANALESAGRWPESRAVMSSAIALAPNEPLVLNFLGYAKLEHGEDLDTAEALIRKASALAPDNASITDSLGWALYKRGRFDEAVDILQKAAIGDPAQADIQEHLGDALYAAGRRFEARFAWAAALATAEDDDLPRIKEKIETGLPATASQ